MPKTFQTSAAWVRQFQGFLESKHPGEISSDDARRFLTHLAVKKRVVASTQNQAFNALLFLYRHILKADYELRDMIVRARRTRFIPMVLSRTEVDAVIALLREPYHWAVQYHLHDSELQKALHEAVRLARIPKRVSCHTFRHSFASHLLRANFDIRTIQQLLGHSDVRTTMIYTHTVKSRTLKEMTSPLDFTPEQVGATGSLL